MKICGEFTHAESARDIERQYPERFLMLGVCADFAPRVGARAVYRAREGIGGNEAKPFAQTKFAADARPSRRRGRRRPTRGFACTSDRTLFNGYCAICR